VRAGLEIVNGIADLREELARERGLDFNVRVGINTGLGFVGAIGATTRFEYTAVGDTMNLAARMEQTAQAAMVQITAQTSKLVEARRIAGPRPAPEAALRLGGQTLSFGQTISYWPFQQILRSWAGITEHDETAVMWSKLHGQVRGLFGEEADEYLPYLGTMLG